MFNCTRRTNKHTQTRLSNHGLICKVKYDLEAIDPRVLIDTETVAVGIEVPLPEFKRGDLLKDVVAKYCKDELECSINDIVYLPVFVSHRSTAEYSVGEHDGKMTVPNCGFIYLSKVDIINEYEVTKIDDALIKKVKKRLKDEIEKYGKWVNKEALFIEVCDLDKHFYASEHDVYTKNDMVDDDIDLLVDYVVNLIDRHPQTATLRIRLPLDNLHEDDAPDVYLSKQFKSTYGFTTLVGSLSYDYDTEILIININLDSIPTFLQLAANARYNLFKIMNTIYPSVGVVELTDNELYDFWPDDMLLALFNALIEDLDIENIFIMDLVRKNKIS